MSEVHFYASQIFRINIDCVCCAQHFSVQNTPHISHYLLRLAFLNIIWKIHAKVCSKNTFYRSASCLANIFLDVSSAFVTYWAQFTQNITNSIVNIQSNLCSRSVDLNCFEMNHNICDIWRGFYNIFRGLSSTSVLWHADFKTIKIASFSHSNMHIKTSPTSTIYIYF